MGNLDVKYLFESQCELIDNIKELLKVLYGKKYGKELEDYMKNLLMKYVSMYILKKKVKKY